MNKVLSKYVSEYDMGDGTVGLFNSVFLTRTFINRDSWSKVKESTEFVEVLPDEEVKALEHAHVIVDEEEDDKRLGALRAGDDMRPSVELMYLFVTNTCNMRCKYCVIDKECARDATGDFMTKETADKALALFFNVTKCERPRILLWGGEPLANWSVFRYAVQRARELEAKHSRKLDISTVINGTLLTKDVADFLKENNVSCAISIDGFREQHDSMRIYADGRGTYDDIRENVKLLREAGMTFGISVTTGSHNVDVLPTMVPALCRDLEIKSMGCNLLLNVDPSNPAYTDIRTAVKQLIELFKKLREEGVYEDRMMRKVKSFVFNTEHLHDCAGGGHQIAVTPNGDIGICHYAATAGKWIIGNVDDTAEKVFGSRDLAEWARRSPINMPQCYECPGLVMCGGGCPYEASERVGDVWALDERFCAHCKESMKWMMEEEYKGGSSDWAAENGTAIELKEVVDQGRLIRTFTQEVAGRVTDEELQLVADAYRHSNGLNSSKATEEWMSSHGISWEFFEEYLESIIVISRLKNQMPQLLSVAPRCEPLVP
jgi:uncharacterized protein